MAFSGAQSTECSMTQFYSEEINKTPSVDENIITENDFLGNKQLMYNIEKELTRSSTRLQAQPTQQHLKNPIENVSLPPVATPLIVFSQAVIPKKPPRFRSILPKKKKPSPVHSVVVVQPLLESNQGLMKKISNKSESAGKKEVTRKVKKKVPLVQNHKNSGIERMENLNMPTIKTPISDKNVNDIKPEELEVADKLTNESTENADVKVTNEEKENLEKTESEKAETPVVVTRRNSKRLSLSTPRRKSHIRALEFETPPKKKEEKKSKTSPKVKVEHVITERKSVRNTLFKSPVPEITLKPPSVTKGSKKIMSETNVKGQESTLEPLNELSIPIATRSPNTKLSDAWENLTGVGCVIGQTDSSKASPTKKMWDADLRCFISESNQEVETVEKKRNRKPEKIQKDNRKNVRKKAIATKKSKSVPTMVSPSKMSLTAKRNTYSIKGNDEGSPLRSLLDDLKIVTPFKDIETIRPTEETPLTKLLRENVNTIDFDLSMINTPSFPPTPSIVITPDLDDISLISGANYYSPSKDFSKEKVFKITDYFRVDTEKASKKDTKEMHEKVIDDLVSKAKEIIGIGKENQEDCALKRRPSGKLLSMVKIQMLTQCDKKLCENIPINEETHFQNSSVDKNDCISNLSEEAVKSDLKEELEEKRKRALKKIKVVKENLSQAKNRVVTRSRKRKRSGFASGSNKKSVKSKSDGSNETTEEKNSSWSDESDRKVEVFHSTPYSDKKSGKPEKTDSNQKLDSEVLNDIRQELPLFEDAGDKYPELTEKSRKKIHYVESFLKLEEIVKFLEEFNETNPPKLNLKASFKRFFQVFYKWLKHPHKRELNASLETKALLKNYRLAFDKVNLGLNHRIRKLKKSGNVRDSMKVLYSPEESQNHSESKPHFSDDDEKEWRNRGNERKKDEDTEDGFVSILPLKKRKSTVQQVELKVKSFFLIMNIKFLSS